ncbi:MULTISPECIES: anti-sigma-F factor Fin family protein [Thermoactinomyces]|jgi:hypothetical protein|uniref:Anti-sigma-F factor Fin family protein n=1 Tax=Thermoactinomyces daqus TaxID=1329516 RepID=A0A7W2AI80_9BACL|nr:MULTISPECIES: anti-sigma-F factor Fin family protein [Thermoactinomyces]MBA4542444.1 anti-sigma-F factor Fin family protein [Thermoactinomyces daqus]MBH8598767.1 anti-sigma-F factor Fin family protein [Thermoactinomyces sp. CICC 10523]MBH8604752.1 anti-sigma-F factor Fin family protein [Thermoactinomyces sp. CICC 10522]MBH8607422.1 anti-sigma-F factor Fin family protein [Thermoactinomyces sp. CICC 10521]
MAIHYVCRHCGYPVGTIEKTVLSETDLGFDQLTPDERNDIISNDMDGNQVVRVTCEACQQVLERDPERLLYPSLYH